MTPLGPGQQPPPREARDVVAFGQEIGRVLSDGRIVGRAEPFAKVFPSSRAIKRAVGVTAWAVLEDIALDASLDVEGRLVAATNVRRIAANLGLSANTVTRHLGRLREFGFVLHEEVRGGGSGRFETARYVLDPSAAIERFTVTPTPAVDGSASSGREAAGQAGLEHVSGPCRNSCDTEGSEPCRSCCDAVPRPGSCDTVQNAGISRSSAVSQSARHRDLGHNREQAVAVQQQPAASDASAADPVPAAADDGAPKAAGDVELLSRLTGLGVEVPAARSLLAAHPADQVRDALDAVAGVDARKPAGWVVAALRDGWEIADLAAEQRRQAGARRRGQQQADERARTCVQQQHRQQAVAGWAAAVVAALDDTRLSAAIAALTDPVPGLGRRSVPAVEARLASWAAGVCQARPQLAAPDVLVAAVADASHAEPAGVSAELPPPPDLPAGDPVGGRLREVVARLDAAPSPDREEVER